MSFSLRVVIADDDAEMRESLRQMLGALGHEVVAVAENGESLIRHCAQTHPDVVITGTLTSEMQGCDAAAVIYRSRPLPIILYSGHCEPDLVLNAEQQHVFMYLVKPICPEHLQAALRECHRTEANEPSEKELSENELSENELSENELSENELSENERLDDETKVPVGPSAGLFGSAPYRELSRPPYRKLPR